MQLSLKVMLVDDEVMALNSLNNLIDWDKEGYKIVAKETNPQKALDSFRIFRPQIIFIDIMMPVMNGLELSEKILSLDIPVKVIILTSYKDFQYAKRAIKIGVSNYLVKHELNKKNLIAELEKLKLELDREKKNDRIVRHRLLRALIDGRNPYNITDKIRNKHLDFSIGGMVFLFCKVDISYPIIIETNPMSGNQADYRWSEIDIGINSESVDIIGLNSTEAVCVIYLESIKNLDILWKLINTTYSKIQSEFLEKYEQTITACPVIVENQIESIGNIYSKVQSVFDYSIFFGKASIIELDKINIDGKNNDSHNDISEYFTEFINYLRELDGEGVINSLNIIYKIIETPPFNIGRLRIICNRLSSILDSFLKSHFQPSLYGANTVIDKKSDLENIFNIKDLLLWFENEFGTAITKAQITNASRYSRKVRQTMDLIHQEYDKDWSIDEIAETLSISAVYLRKLFKNEIGSTIVHYLTELRMKRAIELLETGDYKVFEISEMVGYNTSQYFSKVFRRYTGKSPMNYISGA